MASRAGHARCSAPSSPSTRRDHRRLRFVGDSIVLGGVLSSALSGEALVKGRSLFAERWVKRWRSAVSPHRGPHQPRGVRGRALRRRRAGHPARPASSTAARLLVLPAQLLAGRAERVTVRTDTAAQGGFKSMPGVGARASEPRARWRACRRSCSPRSATGCSCRRSSACTRAPTR